MNTLVCNDLRYSGEEQSPQSDHTWLQRPEIWIPVSGFSISQVGLWLEIPEPGFDSGFHMSNFSVFRLFLEPELALSQ